MILNNNEEEFFFFFYFASGLAWFKPSGFNRGLNHGLNQVVFFLKKTIGFFGFFPLLGKVKFSF